MNKITKEESMEDNKFWFNQLIFAHRDDLERKGKSLEIALSCNTENFIDFSQLFVNIVLVSQKRFFLMLNFLQLSEFILAMKELMNNFKDDTVEVFRVFGKKSIKLVNKEAKNLNKHVVIFSIFHQDQEDFAYIVLTQEMIMSILEILKDLKMNFLSFSVQLINRAISTEILNQMRSLNENNGNLIGAFQNLSKSIYAKLLPQSMPVVGVESTKSLEITEENKLHSEMETFLDQNISLIQLEELEQPASTKSSNLKILKVFRNIKELDDFLTTLIVDENRIEKWLQYLSSKLDFPGYDSLLPDMTEGEFKSFLYISNTYFSTIMKKYLNKSSFKLIKVINKYTPKKETVSTSILSLALELFTILLYLRTFTAKTERIIPEAMKNKSVLYLIFRTLNDPLIFSFIDTSNTSLGILENLVRGTFEEFGDFFQEFDNILENYSLRIDFSDLSVILHKFWESISSSLELSALHDHFYKGKKLSVPREIIWQLTPEQIKKVIEYEVAKNIDSMNNEIKEQNLILEKYEELKDIIQPAETKAAKKILKTYERLIKNFPEQVPEEKTEELLEFMREHENKNIRLELEKFPFNLEDLGEDILKMLYVWEPEKRPQIVRNFSELLNAMDIPLGKEEILTILRRREEVKTEEANLKEEDLDIDLLLE